jgi:multicomponent Na+:H+ antiporter subunit D
VITMVLPLALTWFGAIVVAFMDGRRRGAAWFAAGILAASLAATVVLGMEVARSGSLAFVAGDWPTGVGIRLRADALGVPFAALTLAVLLAALLFEAHAGARTRSFPALVLAMATGLNGLFLTADAFNFYVFFEIAMISAYVMAGYGERSRQLRSAVIFSVANLLGSVLFLFSIVALYHVTGTLDMAQISIRMAAVAPNAAMTIGALLFAAIGIKLGLFPFHPWLPPVYTGTRPAVAAILAGGLANIGSYALIRFGAGVLPRELEFGAPALAVLGAASILYGGIQALGRGTPEEMLAYSSIGQVGYVLVALAIGGSAGLAAAVLLALLNSASKALLFLAVPARTWLLGLPFAVGAFSVAGLPPLAGFWGKAGIVRASFGAPHAIADWALAALVLVGGFFSFVYLFQAYQRACWEPRDDHSPAGPPAATRRVVLLTMSAALLAVGLVPEPLLALADRAAVAAVETGLSP